MGETICAGLLQTADRGGKGIVVTNRPLRKVIGQHVAKVFNIIINNNNSLTQQITLAGIYPKEMAQNYSNSVQMFTVALLK